MGRKQTPPLSRDGWICSVPLRSGNWITVFRVRFEVAASDLLDFTCSCNEVCQISLTVNAAS
jgi:hypothetical protein